MPQSKIPPEQIPAFALHAGDEILAARGRRYQPEHVVVVQIFKGSTGRWGYNYVTATCQPAEGPVFRAALHSEQTVTILSHAKAMAA